MPRNLRIVLAILGAAVLVGLISLHSLNQRVEQFAEMEKFALQVSECRQVSK